ncbi:MAG: bifunctional glutamate N-acetyltransferase/amino-acid acetyltransferase ArgJ [Eubacteriales bacterium]
MTIQFEGFTPIEGGICAPKGFTASALHCGIRTNKERDDLALIYSDAPCNTAAVYTQNKVKGAPITVTQKHLENNIAQAVIVNSGNANTCNVDGEEKAIRMCQLAGEALGIPPHDVVVASTGIIGEILPIEPIEKSMDELKSKLSPTGNLAAREAILTTDLVNKEHAISFELGGKQCVMGGMAKGSGMIHPNMATMLAFLSTDVDIDKNLLQETLIAIVDDTFNMISVDGDTSTNDMAVILSNCKAGNPTITDKNSKDYAIFCKALYAVLVNLSRFIAQDGEGATKLLECNVSNACDTKTAKIVSKSVITSSLFKSAMFGQDPNWGRILCAIGYANAEFDINRVEVELTSESGAVTVCKEGRGVPFSVPDAEKVLAAHDVIINIDLGDGSASATAWGCDLTYDYVKINADYNT